MERGVPDESAVGSPALREAFWMKRKLMQSAWLILWAYACMLICAQSRVIEDEREIVEETHEILDHMVQTAIVLARETEQDVCQ